MEAPVNVSWFARPPPKCMARDGEPLLEDVRAIFDERAFEIYRAEGTKPSYLVLSNMTAEPYECWISMSAIRNYPDAVKNALLTRTTPTDGHALCRQLVRDKNMVLAADVVYPDNVPGRPLCVSALDIAAFARGTETQLSGLAPAPGTFTCRVDTSYTPLLPSSDDAVPQSDDAVPRSDEVPGEVPDEVSDEVPDDIMAAMADFPLDPTDAQPAPLFSSIPFPLLPQPIATRLEDGGNVVIVTMPPEWDARLPSEIVVIGRGVWAAPLALKPAGGTKNVAAKRRGTSATTAPTKPRKRVVQASPSNVVWKSGLGVTQAAAMDAMRAEQQQLLLAGSTSSTHAVINDKTRLVVHVSSTPEELAAMLGAPPDQIAAGAGVDVRGTALLAYGDAKEMRQVCDRFDGVLVLLATVAPLSIVGMAASVGPARLGIGSELVGPCVFLGPTDVDLGDIPHCTRLLNKSLIADMQVKDVDWSSAHWTEVLEQCSMAGTDLCEQAVCALVGAGEGVTVARAS